jgi:dipeptidase D
VLDGAREEELRSLLASLQNDIAAELGAFDPELKISLESVSRPVEVLSNEDARLVAGLLASQHHGVLAMSPDIPGLVQTSTNLAMVSMKNGHIEIETNQRSAIASAKMDAAHMVADVFRMANFEVEHAVGYPGWKPEPGSDIVRTVRAVHKEILGKDPELVAMHAGLECGVIGEKYQGMQMISFGPQIEAPHSPSERLKISSVAPFLALLTGVLERI